MGHTHENECHCHEHEHSHEHDHCHEHTHSHGHSHGDGCCENEMSDNQRIIQIASGALLFVIGIVLSKFSEQIGIPELVSIVVLVAAYIVLGANVVITAVKNIFHGEVFDECFLMALSTVGAFVIGEYPEAVAVMLFYQVGEFFQDAAVERSRKSITDLMDIRPDLAHVKRDGLKDVNPKDVSVGELIVVQPGERIPLDGIVKSGTSMVDTSALTGESVPRSIAEGDNALSGCINQTGVLEIEVTSAYGESTVAKIIDLVENASEKKAAAENFITKFAHYYTPVVVIAALLLAVIPSIVTGDVSTWIYRAFVFLVISCPCALVISIPLTFFGGLGAASRKGVLVKGSNYLEALNTVDTVVFDKTGTLTKGTFAVTAIETADGFDEDKLLELAGAVESFSTHPVAKSIAGELALKGRKAIDQSDLEDYTEIPGFGVTAKVSGISVIAGNARLMNKYGIAFSESMAPGTKVYVAVDGSYVGCIVIGDDIKEDSAKAVEKLKTLGVKNVVMLTGDNEDIASQVAETVGLDNYFANLLPADKVQKLEEIMSSDKRSGGVVFVGDGINDAPVLARADIGVAMGGIGSDAAIEAADVVLMTDEPTRLADAIKMARKTRKIVMQNIIFSITVKVVLLILGALGIASMWLAIFGDVGVMVIAVLNATRMLKK